MIGQVLVQTSQENLGSVSELRRCAREIGVSLIKPVLVAYANAELISNSLLRNDLRRLFPADDLYGDDTDVGDPATPGLDSPSTLSESQSPPGWHNAIVNAARSQLPLDALSQISQDEFQSNPIRLVADFGVSLLSSTSRFGKTMSKRSVAEAVGLVSRFLGIELENRNLAILPPPERKEIYLNAINRQPKQTRRELLQAILAFDLYLVAQNLETCPVPRSDFPWEPETIFVDANLLTHKEYVDFLKYLDAALPPRTSKARRQVTRLIVNLGFKVGLRRSEIRGLRIEKFR